mmetsp:Transcript_10086/g.12786  ORF Transcript_10086/g.12786 Transcript_10086/m.12786 type:complete len:304 (+) Transcript_10086:266-1177(+)
MLRHVVAIVSGGSSGLGAAAASHIVRHGGRAVIADLPSTKDNFLRLAATTCAELHPHSSNCEYEYYPHDGGGHGDNIDTYSIDTTGRSGNSGPVLAFAEVDVRNEENVIRALDLAEEKFGESVNVSISCAGICPARKTLSSSSSSPSIKIHTLEEFNDTLAVNTTGTFNLTRLAADRMAKRKPDVQGMRGCIINTASIAAFEGQTGQVAYAASKGALVGMTLPLARDLAPFGIRVMTIAPGLFATPLLDGLPSSVQRELAKLVPCPSRLGDPDEFGRLVGSILLNPMLNGEVIRLDGALRMPP